ncbi:MAG TPA: DNA polymerase/3'-5' exonuclease PolX [Gemmatimonadaceae bacterium]|nr:DNA polymerase/3'-5' exonuclease PolX [Gemmatimonadaceae bacterium]
MPRTMTLPERDTNGIIAALLRDFASIQKSKPSEWGYKRAAATIFALDEPIEALLEPDGALPKIENIGPKSAQVILEVLETGGSETVEDAVRKSGQASEIEKKRALRDHFLSRAQVVAALRNERLTGPSLEDYRGDLQMHSIWSDGDQTPDDIAAAALARDYEYCALTDHSYGLKIARGVSMADIVTQQRDIDRVNEKHSGRFRLIKGIEANIRADGSVDLTPDELTQFELVVAAAHSGLRSDGDQTSRMLQAIVTPGVHILGHPRGRQYGSRAGVQADWDVVFAGAARFNVAIEIDGDPARQDVDYTLAPRAVAAGCLIALDSDAHATVELRYAETAIAHARLGGVPTDRVINCWPLDRLLAWLGDRR